jgi:hypothetical protein
MNKASLLTGSLAISLLSAIVQAQAWSPDSAAIKKLEADIQSSNPPKLGGKVHDLTDYARYYAGYTEGGHRMIAGEFVIQRWANQKPAGVYIVANQGKFPVIFDGGCGIVNLVYDVDTSKLLSFNCNGVA